MINHGHIHFGENKVQEAMEKWSDIKNDFNHIKLHLIGKLQSNKAKYAVPFFDYIHSLDNLKLADKISNEQLKINKKVKIFIQINIGNESQKNGIEINQVRSFYNKCVNELGLDIIGLMCLPPVNLNPSQYFKKMNLLNESIKLNHLSMGMSSDYLAAAKNFATYLRIGTNIFGIRI